MPLDLAKTATYLSIHLIVGFSVAYLLTGSVAIASGIALIEPMVNAVAFFFHERAWKHIMASPPRGAGREWMRNRARFA
ncbi:Uncharacterized membrane protein [Sphingobium faniae]|nr:Uncharacterized membrane protein [Sphingobium faniae]